MSLSKHWPTLAAGVGIGVGLGWAFFGGQKKSTKNPTPATSWPAGTGGTHICLLCLFLGTDRH